MHVLKLVVCIFNAETKPICNDVVVAIEDDPINLMCSVNYTGIYPPSAQWTSPYTELLPSSLVTNSTDKTSITHTIEIMARAIDDQLNYTCMMYFESPPSGAIPDDTAIDSSNYYYSRNAPEFEETCSTSISVFCKFFISQ